MLKYISDLQNTLQTNDFWLQFMVSDRSKSAAKEKRQDTKTHKTNEARYNHRTKQEQKLQTFKKWERKMLQIQKHTVMMFSD